MNDCLGEATLYLSPTRGRVWLILRTQAGTIFCVNFFAHGTGRPPTVIYVGRSIQGDTKDLCQYDFLFGSIGSWTKQRWSTP